MHQAIVYTFAFELNFIEISLGILLLLHVR